MVFIPQALEVARLVLCGTVAPADLDDECSAVVQRVLADIANWNPTLGQSLESYVTRKALDRRIRYADGRKRKPPPVSIEDLQAEGTELPALNADVYNEVEQKERAKAVMNAIMELEVDEQVFLRLREAGYPLAEAASAAGYPSSDSPENIVRRVKRKLERLLREQPFFRDNPEELALIGDAPIGERNSDARLHR